MSLQILETALRGITNSQLQNQISWDAFAQTEQERGDRVHRYRRYYDGDHDNGLTDEMRQLLRVSSSGRRVSDNRNGTTGDYDPNSAPFNANYMPMVVDTKVDRMELLSVDADNDAATEWSNNTLKRNKFEGLSVEVAEAASRDGESYIFVDFDTDTGQAKLIHEPAYDGISGMVVMYETSMSRDPIIVIKIWHITSDGGQTADTMRVNTYTVDEIRKYISYEGGDLQPYMDDVNTNPDGVYENPLKRIQVVPFRNQATQYDNHGRSDIDDAIPLQDILNRTLTSMVATSELTGFPVRYGIGGFEFPSKITPGMFVNLTGGKPASKDDRLEVGDFKSGDIVPFVDQANWVVDQIYTVTKTPKPNMGAAESGEAKKQNEAPLLGKVKRAQISYGDAWERVIELAWAVEKEYGRTPPTYESFNAKWAKAEIRNDKEILENAALLLQANPNFPMEEYYKIVAPVFGWDMATIQKLTQQTDSAINDRLARLGGFNDPFGAVVPDNTSNANGDTPILQAQNNNPNGV
jgi:hypothetical protein